MSKKIDLCTDLKGFFYNKLRGVNFLRATPLREDFIVYVSDVLHRYSLSDNFFVTTEDGKVREKVLGLRLLEVQTEPEARKIRELRAIGELSLVQCGIFERSLNKSLLDEKYYLNIGQMAYSNLNSYVPEHYDVPEFYSKFSKKLSDVALLLKSIEIDSNDLSQYYIESGKAS